MTLVDVAFGKVDILVNNAGVNAYFDATTMTEADWESVFAVAQRGRHDRRVVEGRPGQLQHQALLRVHRRRLGRVIPEKDGSNRSTWSRKVP